MAQTLEYNSAVSAATPMAVADFTADMDIIQQLDDEPNDVGGLSAAQLKETFDRAGNEIKDYINGDLIPAVVADGLTEQARANAEAERVTNEQERVAHELDRMAAEEERESETAGIVAQARHWAQVAEGAVTGVVSFKGRQGAVNPAAGDYTADMVGAAPAGYGLGAIGAKFLTANDDLDSTVIGGWYYWFEGVPGNAYNGLKYCVMRVDPSYNETGNWCKQTMWRGTDGYVLVRTKLESGWTEWEWVNPPMILGVEYRTTERYLGKPVYTKLVNFGTMPNATLKSVSIGVENLGHVFVDYSKTTTFQNVRNVFPANPYIEGVDFSDGNINIRTTYDFSSLTAYVCLKYTKTTD